jgi:hypothetical protein
MLLKNATRNHTLAIAGGFARHTPLRPSLPLALSRTALRPRGAQRSSPIMANLFSQLFGASGGAKVADSDEQVREPGGSLDQFFSSPPSPLPSHNSISTQMHFFDSHRQDLNSNSASFEFPWSGGCSPLLRVISRSPHPFLLPLPPSPVTDLFHLLRCRPQLVGARRLAAQAAGGARVARAGPGERPHECAVAAAPVRHHGGAAGQALPGPRRLVPLLPQGAECNNCASALCFGRVATKYIVCVSSARIGTPRARASRPSAPLFLNEDFLNL